MCIIVGYLILCSRYETLADECVSTNYSHTLTPDTLRVYLPTGTTVGSSLASLIFKMFIKITSLLLTARLMCGIAAKSTRNFVRNSKRARAHRGPRAPRPRGPRVRPRVSPRVRREQAHGGRQRERSG